MNRKLTREQAIKILYIMDVNNCYDYKILNDYLNHCTELIKDDNKSLVEFDENSFDISSLDSNYLTNTVNDVINNLNEIDSKIRDNSKGWKINRIAKVDLAILRVAIAEILYNSLIPESVSINEAVEISKMYSIYESHKYINGVLGSIYRGIK